MPRRPLQALALALLAGVTSLSAAAAPFPPATVAPVPVLHQDDWTPPADGTDIGTTWTDPNASSEWVDPNATGETWTDPNATGDDTWVDPNAEWVDPNAEWVDPNAEWVDPNATSDDTWVDPDATDGGWQPDDGMSNFQMPGLTPDNLTQTVLGDIDSFWAGVFAARGAAYYSAEIVPVSETVSTNCGPFGPYDNPAAFCPLEDTIYYSVPLSSDVSTNVGDFAWITVLAHEWGHHVQLALGIEAAMSMERELQADCFGGAYAQHALQSGFLQEGDVSEAVLMNMLGGDPVGTSQTMQGAHGSSDYRVTAYMQGYLNGPETCFANPTGQP
ncbi:MAG: neutral zinc metallopeptidase [Thermomicrobiales bacterium]